jgi:hypothetical protein
MAGIFQIRQLEAPRRTLTLKDRALPRQGFEFSLEQRGETRWQVGTDEGEPLLSGTMLDQTEFDFNWKRQHFRNGAEVDGSRVETVEDLVRLVWSMIKDSVVVVISWDAWEFLGWLRRIDVPINRPGEYAVTLTVEWIKEGERSQKKRPKPASDYQTMITTIADSWSTALRTIRRPLALAREAQIEAETSVTKINDTFREAESTIRQFRDSATDSMAVSGRMAESLSKVATEGAALRATAGRQPHDVMPTDEPVSRVVLESYRAKLQRASAGLAWQATAERRKVLTEARPDVLRIHIAFENEDLRLLAYRTYGRIDAWQDVARFNELSGSTLRAGQMILLPRLEAAGIA